MKPYFQRADVTLYLGDCAELTPDCDLIVTDPPYGQEFKSNRSDLWKPIVGDDDVAGTVERIKIALTGLRRSRHIYLFGNRFDLSSLPLCGLTELIWDKEIIGPGDLASPWGPQHERITFAVHQISKVAREDGGGKLAARIRKGSVVRSQRAQGSRVFHHPTEKPVDLLRQLIESSSVMGETVYDPFAGSGSTLIAASLEGRKAIGCEIDEGYCETAAKRIEQEAGALFAKAV